MQAAQVQTPSAVCAAPGAAQPAGAQWGWSTDSQLAGVSAEVQLTCSSVVHLRTVLSSQQRNLLGPQTAVANAALCSAVLLQGPEGHLSVVALYVSCDNDPSSLRINCCCVTTAVCCCATKLAAQEAAIQNERQKHARTELILIIRVSAATTTRA